MQTTLSTMKHADLHGSGLASSPASRCSSWYVVRTKPRQEFRALAQLQNQGHECFLPTIDVHKHVRGRAVPVSEPLFSRYLFIRLDSVSSNWAPIRSTRGVASMLAFGTRFPTLPDEYIDALRAHPPAPLPAFREGDVVTIATGPLSGIEGLYCMSDGEARAVVLIEMMRQQRKLTLSVDALRRVA